MLEKQLRDFVYTYNKCIELYEVNSEELREVINKIYKETGWVLIGINKGSSFLIYK